MKGTALLVASMFMLLPNRSECHDPFPRPATFRTLVTTPLAIEGLTADEEGRLYTVGRAGVAGSPCPVWRVGGGSPPALTVVGNIPAPSPTTQCSPSVEDQTTGLSPGPEPTMIGWSATIAM